MEIGNTVEIRSKVSDDTYFGEISGITKQFLIVSAWGEKVKFYAKPERDTGKRLSVKYSSFYLVP